MTLFEKNMEVQPSLDFGDGIGFLREMPDTFDLSDISRDMLTDKPKVWTTGAEGRTSITSIEWELYFVDYHTKDGIKVTGFGINFSFGGEPYVMAVLPSSINQRPKYFGGTFNNVILPKWVKYEVSRLKRKHGVGT